MYKIFGSTIAITLISLASLDAHALPAASSWLQQDGSSMTLVAGGCGIGWHRGPRGGCRENGVVVAPVAPVVAPLRVCPPGMHLGPHRRECFPN